LNIVKINKHFTCSFLLNKLYMKKYFFVLFWLITFLVPLNIIKAQVVVYDVFTNQSIEVNIYYKEIIPEQPFIKGKIELNYLSLIENSAAAKSINKQAMDICLQYLNKEAAYLKLHAEMAKKQDVLNELNNSKNQIRHRQENASNLSPNLSGINCNVVSLISDVLLFEIKFQFKSSYGMEDNDILILHYYNANLKTGQVQPWKNNMNNSQLDKIQKLISPKLNETYNLATSKLDFNELSMLEEEDEYEEEYDEDYENEENEGKKSTGTDSKTIECEDICERINLKEADIYWYGWGLMISFQPYSHSSKIFMGRPFSIFIPLQEAKEILASIPEFAFVQKLKQPETKLRNFNYDKLVNSIGELRKEPKIQDVIQKNLLNKIPKTMVMESFQLFENREKNYRAKSIYEFNTNGKLISKMEYNDREELNRSYFYDYDKAGNIILITKKAQRGEEETEAFHYDTNANLNHKIFISGSSNFIKHNYFYNGNFIYTYEQGLLDYEDKAKIKQMVFDGKEFCLENVCYILDSSGVTKGLKANKYTMNQGQVGRDGQGRIIQTHFENDRYNFYFNYDSLGRFAIYQSFQYHNPEVELQYHYEGNSMFPYKQTKLSTRSGNNTMELENYTWEFFE
jgi:hypothetical protein